MSDAAHWPYSGGPTGQPVEMQPGEFDAAACTPPLFGQMDAQNRGKPRVIQVQQPLAGAEWKYVHSGPSWFIPTSILAKLVTSAVVANRLPQITLTFKSVLCGQWSTAVVVPASTTAFISASDAGGTSTLLNTLTIEMPDNLIIADGMTLASLTNLIDVGDQYSGIAILGEEFTDFDWA
jgi:hypothetical protein